MALKQSEYLRYDAVALAGLMRRGELDPLEVCQAAVARAGEVNGRLNAICQPQFERGLAQSAAATGALAGVPFLVKDLGQEQAGVACTSGSHGFRHYVPDQDSEFVRRSRQAGLVLLGRTATPELGLKAITESRLWGPTRNPWDIGLTPGGSSGGSGAAVAAGIVPVAGANDGGGSIRIPAAYSGLFGLKPSRGRISAGPHEDEHWTGASSDHVLSRTVRDSAAMLDILAGPAPGDPFEIPSPPSPYSDLLQEAPGRLRIGMFTESPYGTEVASQCIEAVETTARLLEGLGHHVEIAQPSFDGQALANSYLGLYFGEVSANMHRACRDLGASKGDFELETRLIGMLGRTMAVPDYVQLRRNWNRFGRALGRFFQDFDLYLCPTTGQMPARIGETDLTPGRRFGAALALALNAGRLVHKSGQVEQMALEALARTPFTQLANLTGTPAMSVPLHWTSGGLPVGVHFGASHGREDLLLQLAGQLEEARPWFAEYERL